MTACFRAGLFVLFLALNATTVRAEDDVAAFYKGKTIQLLNAFGQGGRYSVLARLVAAHLPRHIPGQPGGVTQLMPGAAGLLQTNFLYNAAPKDGTVIGLLYDSIPTAQVIELADQNVKFDVRRFNALGSINKGETGLVGIFKRAGIANMDDARREMSVFGATGTSGGQYTVPNIMNKLFGTRFKLIPGYKTTAEIYLAMERGEVDGIYGAYDAISDLHPEWLAENRFNWIAQLYDVRAADFPDVPLLQEFAQNDLDRAALRFLALARVPGKIFIAPPGVPPARIAALRAAYTAMLRDDAFKADFAKTALVLDPRSWQESERIIRETVETPPEVIKHVQGL